MHVVYRLLLLLWVLLPMAVRCSEPSKYNSGMLCSLGQLGLPLNPCWCLLWCWKVLSWTECCRWATFCRGAGRHCWVSLCHCVEGRETQDSAAAVNELDHLLVPWGGTRVGSTHEVSIGFPLLCPLAEKVSFSFSSSLPPSYPLPSFFFPSFLSLSLSLFSSLSVPVGGSGSQASPGPNPGYMRDKRKTKGTHHIVVSKVLRSLVSPPSSFQLSESFYHCLFKKFPKFLVAFIGDRGKVILNHLVLRLQA